MKHVYQAKGNVSRNNCILFVFLCPSTSYEGAEAVFRALGHLNTLLKVSL
jgi:hypothetical protein